MGNGDLNTAKANKEIFDKLVKNTEKELRFSFKPSTINKICDKFVANSERLIKSIETSYNKHKKEINNTNRTAKEIGGDPIEKILQDVKTRRDSLIRKLRKWSSKNYMVFYKLFDSELQKLIDKKDYSLKGIDSLRDIYDRHRIEMKEESKNDKTNFTRSVKLKFKKYAFDFANKNGMELYQEKVLYILADFSWVIRITLKFIFKKYNQPLINNRWMAGFFTEYFAIFGNRFCYNRANKL